MSKKIKIETYLSASWEQGLVATRWLFRQEVEFIYDVLQAQQEEFFRIKKLKDVLELEVVDLILISLINTVNQRYIQRSKTSQDAFKSPIKRESYKRKWLLDHQAVVRELCTKHASSRKIADWIRYKYRLEISHTLINQFTKEKGWRK